MYIELTEDNLKEVLADHPKALVQFGAGWCGQCRLMKPKVKRFGNESDTVATIYVDAEKYPNSRQLAEVKNLPTFATYHNGEIVQNIFTSKADQLKSLYDEITNL